MSDLSEDLALTYAHHSADAIEKERIDALLNIIRPMKLFEDEFAPYLEQVVPSLIESCKQADHGEEETITRKRSVQTYLLLC